MKDIRIAETNFTDDCPVIDNKANDKKKADETGEQTESQDAIRLLSRRTDDARRDPDNELYIVKDNGLWIRANEGEMHTKTLLYYMMQQEREREGKATFEDDKHAGFNHWHGVVKLAVFHFAANAGGVATVNTNEFDNQDQHRLLPFNDGTAWDFTQHRMLSNQELKEAVLLDHGWNIPPTTRFPTDGYGDIIIETKRRPAYSYLFPYTCPPYALLVHLRACRSGGGGNRAPAQPRRRISRSQLDHSDAPQAEVGITGASLTSAAHHAARQSNPE